MIGDQPFGVKWTERAGPGLAQSGSDAVCVNPPISPFLKGGYRGIWILGILNYRRGSVSSFKLTVGAGGRSNREP